MDKMEILAAMKAELEAELGRQQAANADASAEATDEETRAESKWDTHGLEASYLARGYAQQFEVLAEELKTVMNFTPESSSGAPIGVGSLIECEMNGFTTLFFLFPCCGGMDLNIDDCEVTVITPQSPVGAALLEKTEGQAYTLDSGLGGRIIQVD